MVRKFTTLVITLRKEEVKDGQEKKVLCSKVALLFYIKNVIISNMNYEMLVFYLSDKF